jgi:hypothetical protein
MEAPSPVLASNLIAVGIGFGKAVEVAFTSLFLVNCGRGNFYETLVAQRRGEHARFPTNDGIFFPLLSALYTLDVQSVHDLPSLTGCAV